jgi:hypothetical protein
MQIDIPLLRDSILQIFFDHPNCSQKENVLPEEYLKNYMNKISNMISFL